MFDRVKKCISELERLCSRAKEVLKNTAADQVADCIKLVGELRADIASGRALTGDHLRHLESRIVALEVRADTPAPARRRTAKPKPKKKTQAKK